MMLMAPGREFEFIGAEKQTITRGFTLNPSN